MRRAFARLVSAALVLLVALPGQACAETFDFGALYTGNFDDADAERFREKMLDLGWHEELWKTTNTGFNWLKPRHYDFTHGCDDAQTNAGDDCDLLYVSGHGWDYAKFPIYSSKGGLYPVDSMSSDTQNVGGPLNHPWEVGVDWLGQFPSNESRWDYDIEWAVFAACGQLNDGAPYAYSDSAPRNSSAKAWGRTLLGTPGRMHGIYGYWNTAPAGSWDVYVVDDFVHECVDHDSTLGSAWAKANSRYGFPWAFATHAENRNDRLHGQGTGPTPDTHPSDPYRIDYYKSTLSGRILDGRGGAYERISRRTWWERAVAAVRGAFEIGAANASPERDPVRAPEGQEVRFSRAARGVGVSLAPITLAPAIPDAARLRAGGPAGIDGTASVEVGADGSFEFRSGRGLGERRAPVASETAVRLAKEYVASLGEPFADAEAAEVRAVTRSRLDLESPTDDPGEVVQWVVKFTQKALGAYIEGPGAGITIAVDDIGVAQAEGFWFDARSAKRNGAAARALGPDVAFRRAGATTDCGLKLLGDRVAMHSTDLVYYVDTTAASRTARPAWRYETEDGSCLFSDAANGRFVMD